MFWLGVSMLVMSLTGIGDDSRAFLDFLQAIDRAVERSVEAEGRKKLIHVEVQKVRRAFQAQREGLGLVGDCIEKLDRDYGATAEAYEACGKPSLGYMKEGAQALVEAREKMAALTTDPERARIRERIGLE